MSTYTQLIYQIVFSTKDRNNTLLESNREKLFRYILGILKSKNCIIYQINGMEDHLHIATHIQSIVLISMKSFSFNTLLCNSFRVEIQISPQFHGLAPMAIVVKLLRSKELNYQLELNVFQTSHRLKTLQAHQILNNPQFIRIGNCTAVNR